MPATKWEYIGIDNSPIDKSIPDKVHHRVKKDELYVVELCVDNESYRKVSGNFMNNHSVYEMVRNNTLPVFKCKKYLKYVRILEFEN